MAAGLEEKLALVTGATQGIGKAIALELAERGATVICSGIEASASATTAQEIEMRGGQARPLELDVSRKDSIEEAFEYLSNLGGLDIAVNNAGIFPRSPVLELDEDEWDAVQKVNLKGTFLISQAAGRMMVEQGRGGRIVNITSGAAFVPTLQSANYASSKAGIVALTRVLALELAPYRITVNAVAPGLTDTAQPRSFYSQSELADIAKRVPLGRIADVSDIATVVAFFCSEDAAYVTGQTLHVNGGLLMP